MKFKLRYLATTGNCSLYEFTFSQFNNFKNAFQLFKILLDRIAFIAHIRLITTDLPSSVVRVSVCVCVCAKTAELIEMPFAGLTYVDPGNHVLNRCEDRTNPLATAKGDMSAMRPYLTYFEHLLFLTVLTNY